MVDQCSYIKIRLGVIFDYNIMITYTITINICIKCKVWTTYIIRIIIYPSARKTTTCINIIKFILIVWRREVSKSSKYMFKHLSLFYQGLTHFPKVFLIRIHFSSFFFSQGSLSMVYLAFLKMLRIFACNPLFWRNQNYSSSHQN